jgi:hypothetical protein
MKKNMTTLFLTLATAIFAQEAEVSKEEVAQNLVPVEVKPAPVAIQEKVVPEIKSLDKSFGYLRLGVADSQLPTPSDISVIPGLGLGYRFDFGSTAVDVSASANWRRFTVEEEKQDSYAYTTKGTYLYNFVNWKNSSLYAGAGLGFSALKEKAEASPFIGFVPSASLGYVMGEKWRSFVQVDVSQPLLAVNKGFSEQRPFRKAFAELSVGAGF